MVLLAGPRQCGKTTLAKSLLDDRGQYLNWDIVKDRRIIREQPKESLQLVLNLDRPQERSGTKIVSLAAWLEALSFESGST